MIFMFFRLSFHWSSKKVDFELKSFLVILKIIGIEPVYIIEFMRTSKEFAGYGYDPNEDLRNFKTSIRDASFVDITFTLTFNAESFRNAYVAEDVESKSNIDGSVRTVRAIQTVRTKRAVRSSVI